MKKQYLTEAAKAEIKKFREEIVRVDKGEIAEDTFTRFRLANGIYGIRNQEREHMIRIKVPYGRMNSEQLEVVADITDKYTPNKLAHVTTRQAIQLHHVQREGVPDIMHALNDCGLTTREACGNTVRNVSCCPFAGVSETEVFDVTYYADVIYRFFLRNPLGVNMPRKFKIALEGCPEDHSRVTIHDLGFVAKMRESDGKTERGFQVYVGGGLGSMPRSAFLLEEFTPLNMIISTSEAVLRIHDRYSNRDDISRARLKFVVKKLGEEEARKLVFKERAAVLCTRTGRSMLAEEEMVALAPNEEAPIVDVPKEGLKLSADEKKDFERWVKTNVLKQKQEGFFGVTVRCVLGDVTPKQMRDLAQLARKYCGGRIRTTITQNLFLSWLPETVLGHVYQDLKKMDLAAHSADHIADITRCPGADTCKIAITRSKGLAREVTPIFNNGLGSIEALQHIKIKISGCFNSCGQHHIADIGFYGMGKRINGRDVPHYQMILGGGTKEGLATFAKPVSMVPAKNAPEALKVVLNYYLENRHAEEKFSEFVARLGTPKFREILTPFTKVPSPEEDPRIYEDWGAEGVPFKISVGKGECAV